MKSRIAFLVVIGVVAAGAIVPAFARRGSPSPLKLKILRPTAALVPGNSVNLTVEVSNRSASTVDATLEVFLSGEVTPFATQPFSLGGRQKGSYVVSLPVPAGFSDSKLEVTAHAGEAETRAFLRVVASVAGGDPVRGETLFTANCARCHGGGGFRNKSPDQLLKAMAKGPGSMPVFASLTRADVIDMLAFINQ